MTRLWIDTDMGSDDLFAIGTALHMGADIAGLSIVAGNVPLARGINNAVASKEVFGWGMPIYAGADAPLACALETAAYVLGEDGMPTVGKRLPAPQGKPDEGCGIAQMAAFIENGGALILALGPLTNLALLLQRRPDLAQSFKLVWMGGCFAKGNHTAVAEFNAAVDPEAIAVVLASGVDFTMVGLECCRDVPVTLADIPQLRENTGAAAQIVADIYEGYVRIAGNGSRPMALYDPVATILALRPELSQIAEVQMEAECAGRFTRGMTVIEWRAHKAKPNAKVTLSPETEQIREIYHAGLKAMGAL